MGHLAKTMPFGQIISKWQKKIPKCLNDLKNNLKSKK